ncbi:MAG TPA: hypothetical protein VK279_06105, partial [Solirubrobacteraceae bacterium]|nr:hypothetical protein [Solirubrobacteraceae bacterium]
MTPPATARARRAPADRPVARGRGLGDPRRLAAERTASHVRGLRRAPAPRAPRRVSGPAGGRAAVAEPARAAAPVAPRIPGLAGGLAARLRRRRARTAAPPAPRRGLADRLICGRVWIPLIGFLLLGIVALQVSMLRLNAGIGAAVDRGAALERANGDLRAEVARLASGERIQAEAGRLGLVMPPAGKVRYRRVRPGTQDARRAVRAIRKPGAAPAPTTAPTGATGTTETGAPATTAPVGDPTTPAATTEAVPDTAQAGGATPGGAGAPG